MPLLRTLAPLACLLIPTPLAALSQAQTVVGGAGNDYQVSVAIPLGAPSARVAVFERLDGGFSGDLWVTHSADGGES